MGVDELMGVTGAEFPAPTPLSVPLPPAPPVEDIDELEDFPAQKNNTICQS